MMSSQVAQREEGGPSGCGTHNEASLDSLGVAETPLVVQPEAEASMGGQAGLKRKIGDVDGLDDTPSPLTAKRQFLGLTFFTSALLGLFPVQKIFKSLIGKVTEKSDDLEAQAPPEVPPADPNTVEHDDAQPLMSEPEPQADTLFTEEDIPADNQLPADAALPGNLDGNADIETIDGIPQPAHGPAFAPVKRPHAAQYIPAITKPLKAIKRSELRRQLQDKVRPAAPTTEQTPAVTAPVSDGTPITKVSSKNPSTRASRGARLIGIASTCSAVKSLYKISALDYPIAADSPPQTENENARELDGAAGTGGLLDGMDSAVVPEQQEEGEEQPEGTDAAPQNTEGQQNDGAEEHADEEMEHDPAQAHLEKQIVETVEVEAPGDVENGVVTAAEVAASAPAPAPAPAPAVPSPEVLVPTGERGQQGTQGGPSQHGQQVRLTESPCNFTLTRGTGAGVRGAASNMLAEAPAGPVEAGSGAAQQEELVDNASAQNTRQEKAPLEKPDDEIEVENEQQKINGVAGTDPQRFIPLPSLLAAAADSDSNDGLWALDSPVAGILSISSAAAAAMRQAAEIQSAEGGESGWTPEQEGNGAMAVAGGDVCPTDSCRRVRFVGLSEGEDEGQEQEDYAANPEVEKSQSVPHVAVHLQNTRGSQGRRRVARPQPQPRFGPGAFVRKPSSPGALTRSQAHASDVEEGVVSLDGAAVSPMPHRPEHVVQEAVTGEPSASAVVIARRLQSSGGSGLRRTVLQQQKQQMVSAKEAAQQQLREAFLNARLAECWSNGEAWARLDLSGIEVDTTVDLTGALEAATSLIANQRGERALEAALEQLRLEWDHLKCLRQRYGGSPALAATAPRSILKKVSAIASPPAGQEATPLAARRDAPGFDDILAAEIILGSGGGSPGGKRCSGGGVGAGASADLTPGLVRSRGIKMLASLQQAPTPVDDVIPGIAAASLQQGIVIPEGNLAPALGMPSSRLARSEDPLGSQDHASKARRVRSRGQRLLQALQSAAAGDPPAAAAAARLIVDPSAGGYVESADITTFISA